MGFNDYFLEATGDTRDRSEEIQRILTEKGACVLGVGKFYVTGVTMPPRSSLMGLGEGSEICLDPAVEEGYAVVMKTACRVENLTLDGCAEDLGRPLNVGNRHGIGFLGDATPKERGIQPKYGILHALHVRNFSGGGITCLDTGYSYDASLTVSDIRVHSCGVGINIPHFSEYHKFTNVHANRNRYGCINNGGNNLFTACSFDGNTVGFFMDNSQKQSVNNSHGGVVGCTFNHTDANRGVGIRILNASHGFTFSSCQIFYSRIEIADSPAIQFTDLNCGREVGIEISGKSSVRFAGCCFSKEPVLRVHEGATLRWESCHNYEGKDIPVESCPDRRAE